jgi:hypothetical protein
VVHHLADAHMNWYIRPKLAVTEDLPTTKPYAEQLWAELADARNGPIESSLHSNIGGIASSTMIAARFSLQRSKRRFTKRVDAP